MRALQISRYGDSDALVLTDTPVPVPAPGEALVDVTCAGVNYIDVYMREGHYRHSATYGSALPITLGMEGGGVIADPNGCDGLREGDRVAWCLSRGSYADYAAVPAWKLVAVPDDIELPVATALMLQGCTAHYLSHSLFALAPGHSCLVHAAAGGVGQLLVQLACRRGASVIATVGSADKADMVRALGAAHAVLYNVDDFVTEVARITGGEGVDVVYDSVGRATLEGSLRCLRVRGTCVNYGGSSGLVESISPLRLAEAGSVFFTRPHLAHYLRDAEEIGLRTGELFAALRDGGLAVRIDRTLALEQAAVAHAVLEGRGSRGKLLLSLRDGPEQ